MTPRGRLSVCVYSLTHGLTGPTAADGPWRGRLDQVERYQTTHSGWHKLWGLSVLGGRGSAGTVETPESNKLIRSETDTPVRYGVTEKRRQRGGGTVQRGNKGSRHWWGGRRGRDATCPSQVYQLHEWPGMIPHFLRCYVKVWDKQMIFKGQIYSSSASGEQRLWVPETKWEIKGERNQLVSTYSRADEAPCRTNIDTLLGHLYKIGK